MSKTIKQVKVEGLIFNTTLEGYRLNLQFSDQSSSSYDVGLDLLTVGDRELLEKVAVTALLLVAVDNKFVTQAELDGAIVITIHRKVTQLAQILAFISKGVEQSSKDLTLTIKGFGVTVYVGNDPGAELQPENGISVEIRCANQSVVDKVRNLGDIVDGDRNLVFEKRGSELVCEYIVLPVFVTELCTRYPISIELKALECTAWYLVTPEHGEAISEWDTVDLSTTEAIKALTLPVLDTKKIPLVARKLISKQLHLAYKDFTTTVQNLKESNNLILV
jgi:hypothetical protein